MFCSIRIKFAAFQVATSLQTSIRNGDFNKIFYFYFFLNQRFKNYDKLEYHHGYVQWLFPNFHKSRFNSTSHSLLKEEAEIFRKDRQVLIISIMILKNLFLDYCQYDKILLYLFGFFRN